MTFSAKPKHPKPVFSVDVHLRVENKTSSDDDDGDEEIDSEVKVVKPMTKYFNWNEIIIFLTVVVIGILYCLCKHLCAEKISKLLLRGTNANGVPANNITPGTPGELKGEMPGMAVVMPVTEPGAYPAEEKRLRRRYN